MIQEASDHGGGTRQRGTCKPPSDVELSGAEALKVDLLDGSSRRQSVRTCIRRQTAPLRDGDQGAPPSKLSDWSGVRQPVVSQMTRCVPAIGAT